MQFPRSILLHLDSSARTEERIGVARQLAEAFEAEVTAMPCTRMALMQYPFALDGAAQAMAIMEELDQEARDAMHKVFVRASAGSARMRWVEPQHDAPGAFARRALYADLIVLGQRNASDEAARELPADFVPTLLVESGRPALVLPYIASTGAAGATRPIGRSVLIAWKETREAARAVSAALPWLRTAGRVDAVSYGESADASLRNLQHYLDAHGVKATLHAVTHKPGEKGDAGGNLLSLAADCDADLLVMGCYGHSRAREWVLGGATRTILESMTLPVLMSH